MISFCLENLSSLILWTLSTMPFEFHPADLSSITSRTSNLNCKSNRLSTQILTWWIYNYEHQPQTVVPRQQIKKVIVTVFVVLLKCHDRDGDFFEAIIIGQDFDHCRHNLMFLLSISHAIVMLTDLSSLPFNINVIFHLFSHAKLGRCLRVPEKRLYIVIYFSFFLEICVLNCNSYAIDHAQIYFHAHMNSFL